MSSQDISPASALKGLLYQGITKCFARSAVDLSFVVLVKLYYKKICWYEIGVSGLGMV